MCDKRPPLVEQLSDTDPAETREWIDSLADVHYRWGPERARYLIARMAGRAHALGVQLPVPAYTPQLNSIPLELQPEYPGDLALEARIEATLRWNAMVMVMRANRKHAGLGGHLATYASLASLLEVGFHHFFHAQTDDDAGYQIFFQGHASPGIYARAFLLGRLTEHQLDHFRQELAPGGGLASYPHPWLMPDFWQYPTVSMGLNSLQAIYQARFNRYLHHRGLADTSRSRVWCFLGDGEMDEPESLGAITVAAREGLDNLIFVVNCNLQRLDGPVRGNGSVIRELEGMFRGAGWNVIKVLWGSEWDALFAKDEEGHLERRLTEIVDGELQRLTTAPGAVLREQLFNTPELRALVEDLSDEQLEELRRGGHDPAKIYAAFQEAVDGDHPGIPTVILAHTIKGYGMGGSGEGKNVAHQQKSLKEEDLRAFRDRFGLPVSDEQLAELPYLKFPPESEEFRYLMGHRQALGGFTPVRRVRARPLPAPSHEDFAEFHQGSEGREVSTTMACVRMLAKLMRHPTVGKLVVPIVPDEARTFGMDALFRTYGIYAPFGQLYEPVDRDTVLYYKESRDGQILEEGITEAGSLASFAAAGTAYATHGVNTIPFFIFYSMFGFQRVMDLIWAAADSRAKGFLLGGTAGRTTLNGEGLQHQDGHSHILAACVPGLRSYDPAYAYETAVIVQDGIRRMYEEYQPGLYYITLYNENYVMPDLPEGAREGIVSGAYRLRSREPEQVRVAGRVQLFGSGTILNEVLRAQDILAERFGLASDVWSVTSYQVLRQEALEVERWNRLHPEQAPRRSYLERCLDGLEGPFVAASDFLKLVPDQIAPWVPGKLHSLGTDGFGRSDTRARLRRHFEVDAEHVAFAALSALAREGRLEVAAALAAAESLGIDRERLDPVLA